MQVKDVYDVFKKMNATDPTAEVLAVNIFEEFIDVVQLDNITTRFGVIGEITNTNLDDFCKCGGKCEM